MTNVVARFVFGKTALYCLAVIAFGTAVLLPLYQSLSQINPPTAGSNDSLFGLLYVSILAIFSLYLIALGISMIARLLIFNRSAVYEKNGRFVLIFPFYWSVKIADIVEISEFERRILPVRKIRILLKNGKEKFIGAALLDEDRSVVIERMQTFRTQQEA